MKINLYILFLTRESFCLCDKKMSDTSLWCTEMLIPYYDLLYSTFVSPTGEKDNADFPTKAPGRSAASCPFNDPHNFYFFFFLGLCGL